MENLDEKASEKPEVPKENEGSESKGKKKKVSLSEFKVKSFVTDVKVEQMQFLKTAGG
ncbi:MAG: pinensin family lanthipeptide [Sporocytophaga sp.]|uniref:pinensin family lanthipeptide n=1 Tax=Sporocytophaga sp. TaxID=2231183 RepID=UPI001B1136E9|nr:pinensin family lanthipeptide [Sporocytophaga sp.]MBO9702947.1 pinensin family lanthipeptide [Sporocytophaga sp.]